MTTVSAASRPHGWRGLHDHHTQTSFLGPRPGRAPDPDPYRARDQHVRRRGDPIDRLLLGLAASIAERGFAATTIADIVREAQTSRRTFYAEFATREDCYVQLLRLTNETLAQRITDGVDPDASWDTQVRQAVDDSAIRRFTGPAGTMFLVNTYGLHHGLPPERAPRLAFQALYTLRPTIYGPRRPLRARRPDEAALDPYVNRLWLSA